MSDRKSKTEVVLMPLVVALVGIVATFVIADQQEKNAQTLSEATLGIVPILVETAQAPIVAY